MAAPEAMVQVEDATSFKAGGKPSLYAARNRVYPKRVEGLYRRLKWIALVVLLGIYYIAPWLRWDRGPGIPDQAFLVDMPNERAYFLFIEIWAQEVYYLTGVLILAAVGLFLVTALGGRVWCGYACPQTVWTDLFMWVERKIEGDRNARMKLDKQSLSGGKVVKKALKHGIWLLIALLTGGAWILYFNDAPTVTREIFTGQASSKVYFFVGLFTATTYTLAGWAREQVCTYMCPWPRFQAAMFDEDTLIVTYQAWRGEPRGKHHKGQSWEERGDCVACNQCVAVCPTGIDIRDGNQLECIGCGLCIDACDTVMDKIGRPRGLIKLDTNANQLRRAKGESPRLRFLRPRTVIYTLAMAAVAAVMIWGLTTRSSMHINVLHDRAPLYVPLSDGSIRNGYTIKISNMRRDARTLTLTIDRVPGATMTVVGQERKDVTIALLDVGQDTVGTFRLFVTAPGTSVTDSAMPLVFLLMDPASGEAQHYETVFRGPEP
ncbi:MAG: cytochrome c oxidase accessory protein CcoG [Alphaproteobacteria bacterium]|nr:cytochrome c oxidase accessory protein CcoG [Alphaproteobacteria bacterium]